MSEVIAVKAWPSNAELIRDAARLGYLDGIVLDATYGEGAFWRCWLPQTLVTNDRYKPADHQHSYLAFPFDAGSFDSVVFDPPYRLSGTRDQGEKDLRYGTSERRTRDEILSDIVAGARECYRVTRGYLLVKCQDQVEGGQMRWQTDLVTRALVDLCLCGHDIDDHDDEHPYECTECECGKFAGARKVDRFDFVTTMRAQPGGRVQRTARHNASQLLVFKKPRRVTGGR